METTQLLRGVLDMAVLAVLQREDAYGYDVLRRLRDGGLNEVGDASVYGTLRRLYRAGALSSYVVPSDSGPNRKYYSLTSAGADTLASSEAVWNRFTRDVSALLHPPLPRTSQTPNQPTAPSNTNTPRITTSPSEVPETHNQDSTATHAASTHSTSQPPTSLRNESGHDQPSSPANVETTSDAQSSEPSGASS